jgi:hypothetical protein
MAKDIACRPQRPVKIGGVLVEVPLKKPASAPSRRSYEQRDEDAPSHRVDSA